VTGLVTTLWESFGFTGRLKHRKYRLKRSALRLYLCCVELVDHDAFIRDFSLPDTFSSWFRITELHLWMCLVRLAQEGKEGLIMRNYMIEYFWQDLDKKARKLSTMMSTTMRQESIQNLSEQFKASLFSYDEGLLGDDKALAGALWRNLFEKKSDDAEHIEAMVKYIRKQIVHLDEMESDVIQSAGIFTFLLMHETPEAIERSKQILVQIAKRV
jgi:cytochrome b pre-mRNA-processing protein 3